MERWRIHARAPLEAASGVKHAHFQAHLTACLLMALSMVAAPTRFTAAADLFLQVQT